MATEPAPALKDWFDEARFKSVAGHLAEIHPDFDRRKFLKLALTGLDELSLLQRMRHMTVCAHETLPKDYPETLEILRELAPRIDHSFVTLFMPDYVSFYGQEHFDNSMEALKFFTRFGSSEFGVREFLKRDLKRTLKVMRQWSRDKDEHVRRLASEGCRPRLPWSFRLDSLIADPSPTVPILENLKADPSLYVRKSVANHLNDISKDHPARVMEILRGWGQENAHTAWIAKRALRTLIKKGDRTALTLIGAGEKAQVTGVSFVVAPDKISLGDTIRLTTELKSTVAHPQKLVIDYAVHYVKKSGTTSAKVFKWKELTLAAGETLVLQKTQRFEDFTTRSHQAGRHQIDLLINGVTLACDNFTLVIL